MLGLALPPFVAERDPGLVQWRHLHGRRDADLGVDVKCAPDGERHRPVAPGLDYSTQNATTAYWSAAAMITSR
jgi:hypothetical protein